MTQTDSIGKSSEVLYRECIQKSDWANLEETLMTMGLQMIRHKHHTLRRYQLHTTSFKIESFEDEHILTAEDKTIDGLIAGLTVIGYSLDRAVRVNLPCQSG